MSTSYVASLIQTLEEKRQRVQQELGQTGSNALPDTTLGDSSNSQSLSVHIGGATRYFGQLSCLSQSYFVRGDEHLNELKETVYPLEIDLVSHLVSNDSTHRHLIEVYLEKVNPLYPFLDVHSAFLLPDSNLKVDLSPSDSFVRLMVYSIAAHCSSNSDNRLLPIANACHKMALRYIDSVTSHVSPVSLQAITLLALHGLFDPLATNFGQNIGLAARLAIDIAPDAQDRDNRMCDISTTIYCLENQVSSVLDRPSFSPEPVSQSRSFLSSSRLTRTASPPNRCKYGSAI